MEEINCTTIPQILSANMNLVVEIQAGNDWISGRISGMQSLDPNKYSPIYSKSSAQKVEF
jgi:hypothetical protein